MENTYEKFKACIGKRIMELRIQRHYTRESLAEQAEISPKFLYEIENGKKGCSSFVLYRLSCSLGVNVDYLLQDRIEEDEEEKYIEFVRENREHIDSIMKISYKIVYEL